MPKFKFAACALIALLGNRGAWAAGLPPGASFALRADAGKLLIIGPTADDDAVEKLGDLKRFPQLPINAALSPAEMICEITPTVAKTLAPGTRAGIQVGAAWQIYPGAGPPIPAVIQALVLLFHGNGVNYVGKIARIPDGNAGNRIAGLRASEYLAVPGAAVDGISQVPMMPVDQPDGRVTRLLFLRGQELVHDAGWQMEGRIAADFARRIREMNSTFLARQEFQTLEVRAWRWNPDRTTSLLFVEAVWLDDDRKLPLFAVDAVLQDGEEPKILSFNTRKAEWMRASEFETRDWRLLAEPPAFRNAWKVGADSFVLTYLGGYEGYSVDLQKVDAAKGLVPSLSFGN